MSEEPELVSIETFSGNILGYIEHDKTDEEIRKFIQETTKNKSHVKLMRTEEAIIFGFIDNRHALIEWKEKNNYNWNWSLKLDTKLWNNCVFVGTSLTRLRFGSYNLKTLPDLSGCVALEVLKCDCNRLTTLPDLSKCVSLTELYCHDNPLTELPDLSKCVLLRVLDY
tara:strand:- start:390 stop:893 length:504 start_codon:yes stop_codon:yes gene_type:complete